MDVSHWSQVADENNEPAPAGMPEGWAWHQVNDAFREWMAAVARWYRDAEWLELVMQPVSRSDVQVVRIEGEDQTALFSAGSPVLLTAGASEVIVFVEAAVLEAGDTLVTVAGAEVPLGCDGIWVAACSQFGSAAYREIGFDDDQVPLAEQVRGIAYEPFQSASIAVDVGLSTTLATLLQVNVTPDGADGESQLRLSLNLVGQVFTITILELSLFIRVGLFGDFRDPIRYAPGYTLGGEDAASGITVPFTLRLPNIPIGVVNPGEKLTVVAVLASDLGTLFGSNDHPTQYSSYEIKRSL